MKKIIVLVLCVVLGVFTLAGCSNNSEPFSQKEYTADGTQMEEIHIDVRDRQIEVSPSEDNQIHIDYYENNKEYYDISISSENILTMTTASNKEWTDFIGSKPSAENRKISLQIPDAPLGALVLSTTNEDISLSELNIEDKISLAANGGNISFEKLDVGVEIDLTVKNGDISGAIAGGYDDFTIISEIKKGESNLPENKDGGEKTLTVSCNNGNVAIHFQNP